MERTLEQVIMDESAKHLGIGPTEAAAIAEAVRGWMREHPTQTSALHEEWAMLQANRIKQLEAEVARLKGSLDYLECEIEAGRAKAKYDELREKFPYLPEEPFYTFFQGAVTKWYVSKCWLNFDDELVVEGYRFRGPGAQDPLFSPHYNASDMHPTAEACRAAIPVEE